MLGEMSGRKNVVAINGYAWVRPRLLLLSLAAFFFSYFQFLGESRDYLAYEWFFDSLRSSGLDVFGETRFEPGFTIVGLVLVTLVASNLVVYGLLVAGAVYLKGLVVNRLSSNRAVFFALVIFYFARYFPLHELTQLRAATAAAFLLFAAVLLWQSKNAYGLLAGMVALTLHLSAVFVMPILLLQPTKRWAVVLGGLVVFVSISLGVNVLVVELGESVSLVNMYQEGGFGDAPNPLSTALLLDWTMVIAGLAMWNRLTLPMKHVLFLQVVGMAIFYAAADFAVVSHRIRELFTVFWLIFVAQGLQSGPVVRVVSTIFLVANVGFYAYLFIVSGQYFS